jgi:hypothetical protein
MFSNPLFQYSSVSQWVLFLGIALILYGWTEKKDKILLAGQILLLLLGLFATWVIFSEIKNIPIETGGKLTKEMKAASFFKGVIILGVVDVASLMLGLLNYRFRKVSYGIVVFIALMLFFMAFNILQMPS